MLAIVLALAHFLLSLYGQEFILITDYQSLKQLMESYKHNDKLAKQILLFLEYNFKVVHRVGMTNLDENGLSRNPNSSWEDLTWTKWHGDCD